MAAAAMIFVLAGHLRIAAKLAAELAIAVPHVLTLAIAASMFASHGNLLGKTSQTSAVARAQ